MNLNHDHFTSFRLFDVDTVVGDVIDITAMDTVSTERTATVPTTILPSTLSHSRNTHSNHHHLRHLHSSSNGYSSSGRTRSPNNGTNDGIRLGFLIPLIIIILCIVSGICFVPKSSQAQVSPATTEDNEDDEKKKKQNSPEFRKQRLIKSFEINNVVMVSFA